MVATGLCQPPVPLAAPHPAPRRPLYPAPRESPSPAPDGADRRAGGLRGERSCQCHLQPCRPGQGLPSRESGRLKDGSAGCCVRAT